MQAAHDRSLLGRNVRRLAAAVLAVALAGPLTAGAAHAEANLSWGSTLVKTQKGISGCYNVATAALNRAKLDNIQTTRSQVSGTVDDTVFVAVTCVGTRPQPTAVVMATSESSSDAQDARNRVLRFIRK